MNVGDLIAELHKYAPHLRVEVLLSHIMVGVPEGVPQKELLGNDDALEACEVIFNGNHVLIVSR